MVITNIIVHFKIFFIKDGNLSIILGVTTIVVGVYFEYVILASFIPLELILSSGIFSHSDKISISVYSFGFH